MPRFLYQDIIYSVRVTMKNIKCYMTFEMATL